MRLEGLSAYWMPRGDAGTVYNDVDIDSMVLLTGPNMAGKSTLARAVCAVALLANCGLLVPCSHAVVPRLDSFMLRNLADDSPLERVSSFAVEMTEARTVLRDAGPNRLILLDELGKGTEPKAAAAIAASVLEALDKSGCIGIFATHHHDILDLPLYAPNLRRMAREVVTQGSRTRPTWKVVDGVCRRSLALDVAIDCGLPVAVVDRARHLLKSLQRESAKPTSAEECTQDGSNEARPEQISALPLRSTCSTSSGRSTGTSSSGEHTFQKAKEVFEGVVSNFRKSQGDTSPQPTHFTTILRRDEGPAPWWSTRTCVYVMVTTDGWVYCGETDAVLRRIIKHRAGRGGDSAEFILAEVPQGKSTARLLESQTIRALASQGLRLLSQTDSDHVHFGSGLQ